MFYAVDVRTSGYCYKSKRNQTSIALFLTVVLIHAVIIFYFLTRTTKIIDNYDAQPPIILTLLAPEKKSVELDELSLIQDENVVKQHTIIDTEFLLKSLHLNAPAIEIKESDLKTPDIDRRDLYLPLQNFQNNYELPSKKSEQYKDIFDPRLRKKLQELRPIIKEKSKIKYLGVGKTLEDIGDGMCLYGDAFSKVIMPRKIKCGPDEGEQMMKNVERALADPLDVK